MLGRRPLLHHYSLLGRLNILRRLRRRHDDPPIISFLGWEGHYNPRIRVEGGIQRGCNEHDHGQSRQHGQHQTRPLGLMIRQVSRPTTTLIIGHVASPHA
jgi:hypothetical protein